MLLNSLIKNSNVTSSVDETGRILFESDTFFTINNASYNIIQLCGIYNEILPLNSEYKGELSSTGQNYCTKNDDTFNRLYNFVI